MKTKELIGLIGGLLLIIGVLFGAYFHFQSTFAPMALADDVKQFKQEYQYDKTLNFLNKAQDRIYTIKERHGEKPKDITVKEELSNLERKVDELKDIIKNMEKK